jgi:hypothetical protein
MGGACMKVMSKLKCNARAKPGRRTKIAAPGKNGRGDKRPAGHAAPQKTQ